jgi:hypothetical protein
LIFELLDAHRGIWGKDLMPKVLPLDRQ